MKYFGWQHTYIVPVSIKTYIALVLLYNCYIILLSYKERLGSLGHVHTNQDSNETVYFLSRSVWTGPKTAPESSFDVRIHWFRVEGRPNAVSKISGSSGSSLRFFPAVATFFFHQVNSNSPVLGAAKHANSSRRWTSLNSHLPAVKLWPMEKQ